VISHRGLTLTFGARRENAILEERRRKRKLPAKPRSQPRDRMWPILVYVNDGERERIRDAARVSGLSVSAYLRAVGTGYRPAGIQDVAAVELLADINKGIGRIGVMLAGRVEADVVQELETVQLRLAEAARR
jgi:hypothetical protein